MYKGPLVQDGELWLPTGTREELHARQVRQAMETLGEPEVIIGPFDRIGRFTNFVWYQIIPSRTRVDWLRRASS